MIDVTDSYTLQKELELERLRAEIETLRKDAARYRWLRARHSALCRLDPAQALGLDLRNAYVSNEAQFDAVIDRAMADTQPKEPGNG